MYNILWIHVVEFRVEIPLRFSAFSEFTVIHTNAYGIFPLNWFLYYFAAVAQPAFVCPATDRSSNRRKQTKKIERNDNGERNGIIFLVIWKCFVYRSRRLWIVMSRYCRLLRLFRLRENDVPDSLYNAHGLIHFWFPRPEIYDNAF